MSRGALIHRLQEAIWHEQPDGSLGFHPLPPPTDASGCQMLLFWYCPEWLDQRPADGGLAWSTHDRSSSMRLIAEPGQE